MEPLEHGNSKPPRTRTYIRKSKSVLERQDQLLSNGKRIQDIYDIFLEESGGPFSSTSSSNPKPQVRIEHIMQ